MGRNEIRPANVNFDDLFARSKPGVPPSIASSAADDQWSANTPAAAVRGGRWSDGTRAGVFALDLDAAPSSWHAGVGFRCASR